MRRYFLILAFVVVPAGCSNGNNSPATTSPTSAAAPAHFSVGDTFLVFAASADVHRGEETVATLSRGDTVQALGYHGTPDVLWVLVRTAGPIGEVEGWVDASGLVRCVPLDEGGCHMIPLDDATGLEIWLSQQAALHLSEMLHGVNEDRIGEAVQVVIGPVANAAGAAAAVGVTGTPAAAEPGGLMAEFVCQALIAIAQENFTKFKTDLSLAAQGGDVRIELRPRMSLAGVLTRNPLGEAAGTLAAERWGLIPTELRGEIFYRQQIQRVLMSISPTTLLDSGCWTITPLAP